MATTDSTVKAPADSTTPPSADKDKKVLAASSAFNHFSQGKRHLLVGDFKSAVSSFKEAIEILVELYGDKAPECGDAYYHYGCALLELARKEAGVLGPDLDGASSQEGSTEEEEEEDEEEEEEESEEGQEDEEDGKKGENVLGKEENSEEKEEDGKNEQEAAEKNPEVGDDKPEEGEKTEEEEEEVTTLQCAWEWLDIARVIFDKQEDTPEISKKRAQIRLSLGEVCMESEDYEGSINEFKQCLSIQEKVLPKDDRSLAESHYQLGLVYSLSDNFDSAVSHFKAAVDVIQLKIKNLQARVEEKNSWTKEQRERALAESKDVFYTEEGEIEDLQQLLPDIQHKITDMEEMKAASAEQIKQAAKAMLLGKGEEPSGSGAVFSQARDGEASTSPATSKFSDAKPMLCQVRRKHKLEDGDEANEQKKLKLENGAESNGIESDDKTKQSSSSQPQPIAVKRKPTQNVKDSTEKSSPTNSIDCSKTETEFFSSNSNSSTQETK